MTPAQQRRYWTSQLDPRTGLRLTDFPALPDWLRMQKLKHTELANLVSLQRCALCLATCGNSDGRRFFSPDSRRQHIRRHLSLESLGEPNEAKLGALTKKAFPNVTQRAGSNDAHNNGARSQSKVHGGKALKGPDKQKSHLCHVDGCGKSFRKTSYLQRHLRIHAGEKPFRCHIDGCGKRFTNSGNHTRHQRIHSGEKPFLCDFSGCGKRFTCTGGLAKHRRMHSGEKPFICDFHGCSKRFTNSSDRTRHRRTHTGEKPFRCDIAGCGKRFTQSNSLKDHGRIHSGDKPFRCEFDGCNKRFHRTSNLKQHEQIHRGEKSIRCDFDGCSQRFTQSSGLWHHRLSHFDTKPFVCDVCEKGLARRKNLIYHCLTHAAS